MKAWPSLALSCVGALLPRIALSEPLTESRRQEEYRKRNYTWPLSQLRPSTEGWSALMRERLGQVEELKGREGRYEGFMQTMRSAFVAPNFTEYGFGLAKCPEDLLLALQDGIRQGLPTATYESENEVINGNRCKFIRRPDLTRRVLRELQQYAETWAGFPLTPFTAYGFRLYQNNSQLAMHVDRMQTHIISFILHIDSSDDADPWPIVIEDLHGRTHEITLTPGDMLFYESAKCFHGRPRRFKGSWYTSVFVHYYPSHGWAEIDHDREVHYSIPPHWSDEPPPERKYERLEMHGTSMLEPDCEDDWCRLKDSIKWSGPAERGYWTDANQEKHPFTPSQVVGGMDEL